MRRRVIVSVALAGTMIACGCPDAESPIDRAVDVTGRDIRDTEYCGGHVDECGGPDPAARVRFKASRLFTCPEDALSIVARPDLLDVQLGHTHGRDFQSTWPEGQISRTRDAQDPGQVFEAQGCSRRGRFTCFHAHVVVRGDGVTYDDPQAIDCVREAPWDPAP